MEIKRQFINAAVLLFNIQTRVLGNVSTDVYMRVVFPKLPTGEEVMLVKDMKVDFRMANVRVHLDNLFNGNKVLGK